MIEESKLEQNLNNIENINYIDTNDLDKEHNPENAEDDADSNGSLIMTGNLVKNSEKIHNFHVDNNSMIKSVCFNESDYLEVVDFDSNPEEIASLFEKISLQCGKFL